eukprot:1186351-Prorocentrum_minimum.AAC.1
MRARTAAIPPPPLSCFSPAASRTNCTTAGNAAPDSRGSTARARVRTSRACAARRLYNAAALVTRVGRRLYDAAALVNQRRRARAVVRHVSYEPLADRSYGRSNKSLSAEVDTKGTAVQHVFAEVPVRHIWSAKPPETTLSFRDEPPYGEQTPRTVSRILHFVTFTGRGRRGGAPRPKREVVARTVFGAGSRTGSWLRATRRGPCNGSAAATSAGSVAAAASASHWLSEPAITGLSAASSSFGTSVIISGCSRAGATCNRESTESGGVGRGSPARSSRGGARRAPPEGPREV